MTTIPSEDLKSAIIGLVVEPSEMASGRPTYIFVVRSAINKEEICRYALKPGTNGFQTSSFKLVGRVACNTTQSSVDTAPDLD